MRISSSLQFDQPGRPYPDDVSASDLCFQHFAIVVTDMKRAYEQLRSTDGWSPISTNGPQQLPQSSGGVTAFKFRDPDGHPLEFLAFPQGKLPPHWQARSCGDLFLGIDHSAISVSDTERSEAFYKALGLRVAARSLNDGIEQEQLDGVSRPEVEVTALEAEEPTPHLELLCYRSVSHRPAIVLRGNDVAATRLVFERGLLSSAGSNRREALIDPDGHHLMIVSPVDDDGRVRIEANPPSDFFKTGAATMTMSTEASAESTAPPVSIHKLLTGQRALVTGANSGIGKGVAIALGQAGADVVVNYVEDEGAAEAVVREIEKAGAKAYAHKADVSSEQEVAAMFARMMQEFGTIDILVNNAGLQRDSAFHEMTLEKWNKVLSVNLTGQFLCAREAIREFLRRGVVSSVSSAAGKIICMSSVHQEIPWAGHANYATSKGGIKLLMESMAQEVAPKRIRVNAIAPGRSGRRSTRRRGRPGRPTTSS